MSSLSETLPRGSAQLEPRFRLSAGEYVVALEVARRSPLCVLGLGDGRALGVDLVTGGEVFSVQGHDGGVLGVSISPDGQRFATCGQDAAAKLWTREGACLGELPGGGSCWVEHVAWAPAGDRIATAAGRSVRVWTPRGEPLVECEPLPSSASGLAWRTDGTGLAASCYGGVHVLPFVAGAKTRHLAWKGSLISLAWSPDAKIIACGSQDSSVHFWRLATGRDSEMSGYRFKPKALAWDCESKLLATSGDAAISVWDFRGKGPEGTRPIELRGHGSLCTRLAFGPRTSILASGSQDGSVLLWDPRRSRRPKQFAFLEDEVTGLGWDSAQQTLVGADASGNVRAWQLA